jgi:hypothetical protein
MFIKIKDRMPGLMLRKQRKRLLGDQTLMKISQASQIKKVSVKRYLYENSFVTDSEEVANKNGVAR